MTNFGDLAQDYLAVRRALGYKLVCQGRLVSQFADFLDASEASLITTELCVTWARQPANANPRWWNLRLSVARGFARHLHALNPGHQVPPHDVLSAPRHRVVPYIYSSADIESLMNQARMIPSPLRACTYETLIGLLAVTGMRVGEAVGLDRNDVDLNGGTLVVRGGKNGRSRELPLHRSTLDALGAYTRRRQQLCPRPRVTNFFVSAAGSSLDYRCVWRAFDRLRTAAGLCERSTSRPPRLHDLRHSFILRTLVSWYQTGVDIEAKLPLLSTYLGHVDPASSYWYFEATPELLALAAERFDHAWDGLQ
jgi:integrase